MAKKEAAAASHAAAAKPSEDTKLMVRPISEIEKFEVPEFLKDDVNKGLEHITKDDIITPRLAIAQGLSPQINTTKPEYIDGLKLGEAFNTVTKNAYGMGPWEVAIVRADPPRYIEFIPREEGGGVKDLNVPHNDARTAWTVNEKGDRVPPLATQFYDFVLVILATREVIAISFKSTGLKIAKELNSLLKLRQQQRQIPMIANRFNLRAIAAKNAKGDYFQFQFTSSGLTQDVGELQFLKGTFDALKGKELKIDREPGDDSDDDAGM